MEVGNRYLITDTILVYFVKGDMSSGDSVALQGDRGHGLEGPKVLLERLVKWDLLEAGGIGARGEKGEKSCRSTR